ncbi:hypothetical protein K504DRAFT_278089 [Pleomassaria siparia CBS 279.74]|uniref:Uncharacterized protein n=1 Tax=Pleomassaria siparia CBS 279.74 TaxID=1314801 RepID=A0A6G1K9M7_9PLEO|nr:hypothetical protein K504DRAFT_278089 [Pleomassaria siparia CBS 279.74]
MQASRTMSLNPPSLPHLLHLEPIPIPIPIPSGSRCMVHTVECNSCLVALHCVRGSAYQTLVTDICSDPDCFIASKSVSWERVDILHVQKSTPMGEAAPSKKTCSTAGTASTNNTPTLYPTIEATHLSTLSPNSRPESPHSYRLGFTCLRWTYSHYNLYSPSLGTSKNTGRLPWIFARLTP